MNVDLLKGLIDAVVRFEEEGGAPDLTLFATWLYEKTQKTEANANAAVGASNVVGTNFDDQLTYCLITLNQHAKYYIKTAFKGTLLVSNHDFSFMAGLWRMGDLRKSELIQRNVIEFSPGMEVIKRLLRQGLIEEFADPQDGRSRRVRLTELGKTQFAQVLAQMRLAAQVISGSLSETEKAQLLNTLHKLLNFHKTIWEQDFGEPLETIIEKYLS